MIKFDEELKNILENDPLGLLVVKPKVSGAITADERLVASFQEINEFIQENGKEPELSRDISERKLYSRLKGLRESPEKAEALRKFDSFNLLSDVKTPYVSQPKEINTIDDILEDDVLGILDKEADPSEIFNLKHVPKKQTMPDEIAKRKPCKEFAQFEAMFEKMHEELANKTKITEPFYSERQQIKPREFFILQGMLVYVAEIGHWEKKNFGNFNAKTYCVFENGTESRMLLRSLAAALWKDQTSRHIVDPVQITFDERHSLAEDDRNTGYVYVLRSLSNESKIKGIENLYKIGYSSEPAKRFHNAKRDPTFLMADVKLISEFQVYNMNAEKLEILLHRFFAEACVDIDVFDEDGHRYCPREWFVAPLEVITQAVKYLVTGEIVHLKYDVEQQQIVRK